MEPALNFKSSFQQSSFQSTVRNPQSQETAELRKKKKRKIEKFNSTVLRLCGIESELFNELVDFEKMVDLWTHRRASEIWAWQFQNFNFKHKDEIGKLRVVIEHNYTNQGAFYHMDPMDSAAADLTPSWTLRIYGSPMPDSERKFSSFFSSIFVDFEPLEKPNLNLTQIEEISTPAVEWHNDQNPETQTEGFEIKRSGTRDLKVKIVFKMHHMPELYELTHPELIQLAESRVISKPKLVGLLYHCLRRQPTPNTGKNFPLDENLKKVFQREFVEISQLPELVNSVLQPLSPIELTYNLKLSGDPKECAAAYDINICSDERLLPEISNRPELEELNGKIDDCLESISQHCDRRQFFLDFSNNPTSVMHELISEQIKKGSFKAQGGVYYNCEEERQSSYFRHPLFDGVVSEYMRNFLRTKFH